MQNLAVAVFAFLLGVGVYSNANAAMPSPGPRAAANAFSNVLSPGDAASGKPRQIEGGYVLLVQGYGGGGGDDDDDRPAYRPQPQYHPQQHYQRNDNGNGNGAAAGAAIIGGIIGAIQEQQRRKRIEEDNNRYQREQNYRNNKRREDDLRNQKRREDARRDEIKRREEAIKRKENAKKEDAAKARLKEKIQELEDEKNAAEKEKKLPGYSPTPSDDRRPVVVQPYAPDPQPYHDTIGPNVITIVPPPDNCPDNFSELKVGPTTLYPRRTDFPADSSLCAGRTSKGCYLRLQNAPASCGGSAPVCVEYCIDQLPPPVVTPKPIIVTPNPVVEDRKPVVKIYPDVLPPTYEPPKPVVEEKKVVKKTYPTTKTDIAQETYEPKPKPKPAVKTDIAQETYEPKPKPKPAVKTDIAQETYEPKPKPKPAVKTDIAQETYEPKPKPKPAVKTDIAQETYEPKPKPKPAVKTDIAQETYEPKPKPKPAVKTDIAQETYEPKPKPKPAVNTDKAQDYSENKPVAQPPTKTDVAHEETEKKSPEPAVKTDKASDYKETTNTHEQGPQTADTRPSDDHKDPSSTAAKRTDTANNDPNESKADIDEAIFNSTPPINPIDCPNLNFGPCAALFKKQHDEAIKKQEEQFKIAREEKKKREDAIAREKKKAAEDKDAIENPGTPDSKGCTANGDIPIKTLLADPNYGKLLSGEGDVAPISTKGAFEKLHLRAITSAELKLVPEVGSVLSGAVDFLWTDPKADRLFDEMLDYVNRLVPDSITKERMGQQSFDIAGLRKLLKAYKLEDDLYQKGLDLKILTNRLAELEPAYLDNPDTPPEKVLPLVVAYGKLRLAALREQLLHQKEYFPNHASTSLVSDYNDAVGALTAKAKAMKDAIIANRLSKIHLDDNMHDAKDEAPIAEGGMFMGWPQAHYFSAHDDFCAWNPAEHKEDRAPAQTEFDNRKAATKRAYERDLDLLLAPITKWPSLTPVARTADAKGRPVDDGANLDEAMPSAYIDRNGLATLGDADGTELGSFAAEALKSAPLALAKSCTRHLRNNSNDTWEVRGVEGSGVCEKPGSCVAKPHHTIEIHYPVLEQPFKMTITGSGASAYHDTFEVKQGNLITTGNCAYIKHDGRTGLARLNQPADGDITALNGDEKHRLARRMESIRRIVQPTRRRECLRHPSKCRYAHDD